MIKRETQTTVFHHPQTPDHLDDGKVDLLLTPHKGFRSVRLHIKFIDLLPTSFPLRLLVLGFGALTDLTDMLTFNVAYTALTCLGSWLCNLWSFPLLRFDLFLIPGNGP
jgi:hypothetical protein